MILIVDDDPSVTTSLGPPAEAARPRLRSRRRGPTRRCAAGREQPFDLVLQDMNFSRDTSGEEGLGAAAADPARCGRELPVILITAWGSIALAVEGMKAGAADFVTKPWSNAQLLQSVETALSLRRARDRSGRTGRRRRATSSTGGIDLDGLVGDGPGLPARPRARRPRGADRRLGADHGRERHGQGADRRGDPPQQPPARRPRSSR